MYRMMALIRRFEVRFKDLRDQKKTRGGISIAIGQEAVAVGVCSALRTDDYITGTHRSDAHCLAKGANPKPLMAEFFGRETGYCHGRGGAKHTAYPEIGLMGTNGVVGGGIPIANGLALASKRTGSDRVAVAFFGDGASNTGACLESLNLAAAWKLPTIFVCENNFYGIATGIEKVTGNTKLYQRGEAFGMPAKRVDGNDVEAVYDATTRAVEHARKGEGPTFLECLTYRWDGWGWKDKNLGIGIYRTQEEYDSWVMRCPVKTYRQKLLDRGVLTEEQDNKINTEIEQVVEEAIEFALSSPFPDERELEAYVYA
jgi:TPP-dependent pyruvate/acetoin dehydrogenase alpha subunit